MAYIATRLAGPAKTRKEAEAFDKNLGEVFYICNDLDYQTSVLEDGGLLVEDAAAENPALRDLLRVKHGIVFEKHAGWVPDGGDPIQ